MQTSHSPVSITSIIVGDVKQLRVCWWNDEGAQHNRLPWSATMPYQNCVGEMV